MLPRIVQREGEPGFHWTAPTGEPRSLAELVGLPEAEPERWLPTHLEALDDSLILVAARFGEVLGGARGPRAGEQDAVAAAYRAIDRMVQDYDQADQALGGRDDLRAGQIVGTAALMGVRLRHAVGMTGPPPLDGELDDPAAGVVSGRGGLHWADEARPWKGARWLVVTDDHPPRRLPATLGMLLFDSSGVDKEASLTEHREALRRVSEAVAGSGVEPLAASGAVDWLLFDWLMAHRESPDSGAVEIRSGRSDDARMIVRAAGASIRVRARFDPGLLAVPVG